MKSDRQAVQTLSRVGRYGERCVRIMTSRTSLIDEELHLGLVQSLIDYQIPFRSNLLMKAH